MNTNVIDGFVLDLDGTVYLGEDALPGAVEAIKFLTDNNKSVLYVTNKPLYPREVYAEKLTRLGIPAIPDDVITSGFVLGYYLKMTFPDLSYYVIGEDNLKNELLEQGLTVLPELLDQDPRDVIDASGIDAVVVAFDRMLDYRKLNTAYQALLNGAKFIATNPDKMCPMPGGGIPDAGATIAALEYITGRKLEVLAGKPSKIMMGVALDRLGMSAENCIMVGDRLTTDIVMGHQAGMHTAVVLTGEATLEESEKADPRPDFIVDNLHHLVKSIYG